MDNAEKTVFLSYRRTLSRHFARLLFTSLRQRGYDVFFDYEGIDSGTFERVILTEIARRAHFLLILGPATLEGCERPADWVRREYEEAVRNRRNIVPVLDEIEFSFVSNSQALPGLQKLQAIRYVSDYHEAFLDTLCERFLQQPRFMELNLPQNQELLKDVARITREAEQAGPPTKEELRAEELLKEGWQRIMKLLDPDEAVAKFNDLIALTPESAVAYNGRGVAYRLKGEFYRAVSDHDRAIELDPLLATAYTNRGCAYRHLGELDLAISDHSKAIELNPKLTIAYLNRSNIYMDTARWDQVIEDCNIAIALDPNLADSYSNRGGAYANKGEWDKAIVDCSKAIELDANSVSAHVNRAYAYLQKREFHLAFDDSNNAIQHCPKLKSYNKLLAMAYNNRGAVYQGQGNRDKAKVDFQKAHKLAPTNEIINNNLRSVDSWWSGLFG